MKGREFQCLRDPECYLEGRSQTPGGMSPTSVDPSSRESGCNQEEEEVVKVSKLWNQGRGPGRPGSGVGLPYSHKHNRPHVFDLRYTQSSGFC